MKTKPNLPHRRRTRLLRYDYGQPGGYFVTICVQERKCIFGNIRNGRVELSEIGKIIEDCWSHVPCHFNSVKLDVWTVMPNHIHGIVILTPGTGEETSPLRFGDRPESVENTGTQAGSHPNTKAGRSQGNRTTKLSSPTLGQVMAYFKYESTKRVNQHRDMPGVAIWQRNYFDHVIRDDLDLQRTRQYIVDNPARWEWDKLHPSNLSR